jgi:hypothetical protein
MMPFNVPLRDGLPESSVAFGNHLKRGLDCVFVRTGKSAERHWPL